MKGSRSIVAGLVMMLCTAGTANATSFQIQMSGINLNYSQASGEFCDSGGGLGCFATPDPLATMSFFIDGVLQGTLLSDIQFNFLLFLPAGTSPFVNATTGITPSGSDIFDAEINDAPGLFTDITSGSVTFSNGSVNATGTGFSTVFGSQSLPFGFFASNPVNWSFSSGALGGVSSCTGEAGQAVCTYAGTGEMSWTSVPDGGSTLALLGLGFIGLRTLRRRFAAR